MSNSIYSSNQPFLAIMSKSSVSMPQYGNITLSMPGSTSSATYSIGGGTGYSSGYSPNWNTGGTSPSTGITVSGDAKFDGNIHMNGRNLTDVFAVIESRLGILQPNPALEQEWEELHDLRMKYVKLERELMEKQRIFDILKNP